MTLKLRRAREKTRLSAIGEAASWISHELKNSLMLLKLFVHSFPEEHDDEDFVKRFDRLVPSEISRWERLLNELSGLSSRDELKISPVDINELLAETLEMMAEQFKKSHVDVRCLLKDSGFSVMADQERLKQVFVNLILNALNAMPQGGTLTVSSGLAAGEDASGTRFIETRIEDTGRGFPREALEKIFDPFYNKTHQGPRGLGLLISRRIIEQHKGDIGVESRIGAGTTFIVRLPLDRTPIPSRTNRSY
jgi:signal transduction histidine kinase